jgi:hypothetical protein
VENGGKLDKFFSPSPQQLIAKNNPYPFAHRAFHRPHVDLSSKHINPLLPHSHLQLWPSFDQHVSMNNSTWALEVCFSLQ